MIPVILGPKRRHYVIDHHHLALALHDEGVKELAVTVIANLSELDLDAFWTVMDNRSWMHPFDAKGQRRHYRDIPKSVTELVDDPFRSLAGELRRAGGFAKDTTPFREFLWADFLRRRMKRKLVERDFGRAVEKALALARTDAADYLPGWCGPVAGGRIVVTPGIIQEQVCGEAAMNGGSVSAICARDNDGTVSASV